MRVHRLFRDRLVGSDWARYEDIEFHAMAEMREVALQHLVVLGNRTCDVLRICQNSAEARWQGGCCLPHAFDHPFVHATMLRRRAEVALIHRARDSGEVGSRQQLDVRAIESDQTPRQ